MYGHKIKLHTKHADRAISKLVDLQIVRATPRSQRTVGALIPLLLKLLLQGYQNHFTPCFYCWLRWLDVQVWSGGLGPIICFVLRIYVSAIFYLKVLQTLLPLIC